MQSEALEQHRWLQQLVGSWEFESSCQMGPGQDPMLAKGRERVRALGDLWIICEGEGEIPGGGMMQNVMTLGYDPSRGKFIGSWIGSPMSTMFIYEGSLDSTGKVLPLDTEGPNVIEPGGLARYQDIIEVRSNNERAMRSQMLQKDGAWMRFMEAIYRRTGR